MSTKRALALAAAPCLAAVLLTSCGIPEHSAPEVIEDAPTDFDESSTIDVEKFLPNSDVELTVQNFLRAATGDPTGRQERLGEFTEAEHQFSDPNEGVNLLDDVEYNQDVGDDLNTVTITVTGSVTGNYRPDGQVWMHTTPREYKEKFVLERERPGDVWTVLELPLQVTLLASQFELSYERAPLYFRASGSDLLVPDLRWIYDRLGAGTELETRLGWLLQGPSDWAKQSASSAIPPGTGGQITEEDERLIVDLSFGDAGESGAEVTNPIAAEIAWSLGLTEEFELRVDGEPVETGSRSTWRDWNAIPSQSSQTGYYVADDTVWQFEADDVTAVSAEHPWVGFQASGLRQVAVARDAAIAAIIADGEGTRLDVGDDAEDMRTVEGLTGDLRDPHWLDRSTIILVDDGVLTAVDPETGSVQALAGESVTALELAPEGRRLAYVEDERALALPLKHDADGNLQIGESREVGPDIDGVTDVAWSSEAFLWVAGDGVGDSQLFRVAIDNSRYETQSGTEGYPTIEQIAAGPADPLEPDQVSGEPVLVVMDGELYRVHSTSLQPIDDDGEPVNGSAPFTVLE